MVLVAYLSLLGLVVPPQFATVWYGDSLRGRLGSYAIFIAFTDGTMASIVAVMFGSTKHRLLAVPPLLIYLGIAVFAYR